MTFEDATKGVVHGIRCSKGHMGTAFDWGHDCRKCLRERIQELERILNAICGVLGVEHYGSAKAAIGALQQENQRLREALEGYAEHDRTCMLRGTYNQYRGAKCKQCGREYKDTQRSGCPHEKYKCTCGLEQALGGER